jgi:hypothetical protein
MEAARMTEPETSGMTLVRQCGAPTKEGGVCHQIVSVNGTGLCVHHDPLRAAEATRMRRIGAERANRRERLPDDVPPPPAPTTLQGVCDWLTWVTVALARGQVDKSVATGCAYALQNLKSALALRDLEAKYAALAKRVEALKGGAE